MKLLHLLAAGCVICACSDATAPRASSGSLLSQRPASNDTDQNETVPFALATVNPCNADAVVLTGDSHILIHSTDAGSGNQHFYFDIYNNYSGVGAPSLVNYNGNDRTLDDFTSNAPLPYTETVHIESTLNSQTGEDNYQVNYTMKITINSNGVPTAQFTDASSRCNG